MGSWPGVRPDVWPGMTAGVRLDVRPAERPAGRPDGRLSAAPVSSAAPKKKTFDRGGPVWPPRSNAADDHLGGGSLGVLCPPNQKSGGLGGSAPQPKFFEKTKKQKNPGTFLTVPYFST